MSWQRAVLYRIHQVPGKEANSKPYIVGVSLLERFDDLERFARELGEEQFTKDVTTYVALAKRRTVTEQKKKFKTSFKKDFKFARENILTLLNDLKKTNDSPEIRKAIGIVRDKVKFKVYPSEEDRCFPDILNIGNYTEEDQVFYTASTALYPTLVQSQLLGHEIAHSIDPCRMELDSLDKNPFKNLISCLRNDVGQFKRKSDDSTKIRDWCYESHTNEAFCDYMGVYVVEQKLKESPPKFLPKPKIPEDGTVYLPPGYEYLIHDLDISCSGTWEKANPSHPSYSQRFRNIILKSPQIAKLAGCEAATEPRCDIKTGLVKPQSAPTTEAQVAPASK